MEVIERCFVPVLVALIRREREGLMDIGAGGGEW